jgi:putative glutamine amidotransferase
MLQMPLLTAKTRRRKELIINLGLICLIPILLQGCHPKAETPVIIALSKGSPEASYANYYNWISSVDSTVICLDMYDIPIDSALKLFKQCSGLLLTGGTDINPALYQDTGASRCMTIDDKLDQLELRLIDSAMAWNMPVLGICRGHQMLNVAFGGSLIIDIPTDYDTTVAHRCQDYQNCFHSVNLESGSMLNEISGIMTGTVNSNHHQGIKKLSSQLKVVAHTSDDLPEAVEWNNPAGKPFLLGVQWHPERLEPQNPLSTSIGVRFLGECRKFR